MRAGSEKGYVVLRKMWNKILKEVRNMFCGHCGREVKEGEVFCWYCGEKINEEREFLFA